MGKWGQTLVSPCPFPTLVPRSFIFAASVTPLRNKMGTDPAFPAHSIQFGI